MSEPLTHAEMADEMAKLAWSKGQWLSDFATGNRKRPDHEIEIKRREHAALQQAAADYQRAANRTQPTEKRA